MARPRYTHRPAGTTGESPGLSPGSRYNVSVNCADADVLLALACTVTNCDEVTALVMIVKFAEVWPVDTFTVAGT